ncbi:MAG TPA: multicopper oxidase domain-containing protein, partial [Bryobacteraceae bacterium]
MTRREFIESALAGSLLVKHAGVATPVLLNPNRLTKFVDHLRVPPIVKPSGLRNSPFQPERKVPFYRMSMRQIDVKVHRELPPTKLWGFGSMSPGPTIEARREQPVIVEWANELPAEHFLPIDHSIHGANAGIPDVRTVIHLHGGRVPPQSDGYPENWYVPGRSTINFYPNRQNAATLWYHDHAMAITRLNMFAGLFGLYILRDEVEDALNLPKGDYELPLILYDRSFRDDGQLYYPVSADPNRPWVPEFFGDAILVNGSLFPFLNTEPRKYRFRLVNASNSRFLYLTLSSNQAFWQIGSDQGLLEAPVELRTLTLAPGERADVIIDFQQQRGQGLVLRSDNLSICQFRVSQQSSIDNSPIPEQLRSVQRISEADAIKTRLLTLQGGGDSDDPTSMAQPMLLNGAYWHDPVTEDPRLDTFEIWSFVNVTDDAHPIHLHQVRFQVLDRRPFDVFTYLNQRQLRYTGDASAPDANELGWKDTVRADPGVVTRII